MSSARQPPWSEVLDRVLDSRLRSVHTALPGTITAYDAAAMTATVEVAVELEAAAGAFERVPPLADVPVVTPGAWAAGDRCLLAFSEESFSKWWVQNSVEPPEVLVRHGLHAVCVPFGAAPGQSVEFVALSNLVDAKLNQLRDAIATAAQGETAASGLGGMNLLASALTIPPAPTPPTGAAWPVGSVAATKLKAR